jgi:protein SCO1/2
MNNPSRRRLLLAAGAAVLAAGAPADASPPSAAALPSKSIYQLPVPLTDQGGRAFQLAELRGAPVVVSMFYTSCQFTCPMLIEAIRANEQKLTAAERARLKVALVSFDPERDTVPVLRKTAEAHGADGARWALARTDAASARKLAAVLGIRYRAVAGGEFNHTTALILLDADGQIVAKTNEVGGSDAGFVKELKRTLAAGAG